MRCVGCSSHSNKTGKREKEESCTYRPSDKYSATQARRIDETRCRRAQQWHSFDPQEARTQWVQRGHQTWWPGERAERGQVVSIVGGKPRGEGEIREEAEDVAAVAKERMDVCI